MVHYEAASPRCEDHAMSGTCRITRGRRLRPMRTLLLITALAAGTVQGEEASGPTMRQKLHAKIMESAPPSAPPKPSADLKNDGEAVPAVAMKPMVVSESKVVREVTAALEREKQNRQEERFSPMDGGKIVSIGRLQVGGWWDPSEGWTFLRLNKGRTRRQAETAETTLKELQELASLADGGRPAPKPYTTKFPWWRRTTSDC